MIRLRPGKVTGVVAERPGLIELTVEVEGRSERAIAYPSMTGPVSEGDRVLLNTTAVRLGLGTGGDHFVIAVEGQGEVDADPAGHVMKLRYTPLQVKVRAVEEQESPDRRAVRADERLRGLPALWLPLHSMLAAAAAGARAAGARRIVYVMTDGAALPAAYSRQVVALRDAGLLDAVVTTGQAFGGDHETVNVLTGLLAAERVAGGDVALVGDGPGKVGTGTRYGASDVASGMALNAAHVVGARPIAVLRLNFADPAYRHHGVSPHSLTVLHELALTGVHVAVPALVGDRRTAVWDTLRAARLEERHQLVEVAAEPALELLRSHHVGASTMGRSIDEEPEFFLAAGAGGILAGRIAAEDRRWREQRP